MNESRAAPGAPGRDGRQQNRHGGADLAQSPRLCPQILATAASRHFVRALQNIDDGLLAALADYPRSITLLDTLGLSAMLRQVLPTSRRNQLATADWTVTDKTYALHALMNGFSAAAADRRARPETDDPATGLAAAVTALLGREQANRDQVEDAAGAITEMLADLRTAVLESISRPASAQSRARPPRALALHPFREAPKPRCAVLPPETAVLPSRSRPRGDSCAHP